VAFELQKHEPLGEGIRRMAAEQLALAVGELTGGGDPDQTVHNVRKRLKELRAILRLVRGGLDRRVFDRDNRALRDAARPLSESRDATVMVETVDMLGRHARRAVPPLAIARLHETLANRRDGIQRRIVGDGRHFAKLAKQLASMEERVARWGAGSLRWDTLAGGLHRVYRNGRNAMAAARGSEDVEDWHEWRKRAKDFRYQLEMLTPIDPTWIGPLAVQAKELGDLLGEDHDFAVLHDLVAETYRDLLPPNQCAAVVKLIQAQRATRERKALKIGDLLYAGKPDRFVKCLGDRWDKWWRSSANGAKQKKAQGFLSVRSG
jgi:CHAD domain-containing protein